MTPEDGRPLIHTSADMRLWLDGYNTGATTVLRVLGQVPDDMLRGVIAHLAAAHPGGDTVPTDAPPVTANGPGGQQAPPA